MGIFFFKMLKKKRVSIAENFREVFVECIAGNPPLTCISPINMFRVIYLSVTIELSIVIHKIVCD